MFFLKTGMSSVYSNKMVIGRWLKSHLFLMVLEAGEPKFMVTARIAPGKGSSRVAESHFLTVREGNSSRFLFWRGTDRGFPLHHLICTPFSLHTGQNTRLRLQRMGGAEMSSC